MELKPPKFYVEGLNCLNWSGAMIVSLTAKNKIGFLNGTIAIPDASSIEYISWKKCNLTIFSLIINSILREIASSLIYTNNVREVWLNLRDKFSQGNALRISVLQRELSSLTEGQLSIETYRFKALSEQLINFQVVPDFKGACTCS